jgi:putative hydrolase of the HAD superfamily
LQPRAILFDFYNTLGVSREPGACVEAEVLAEFGFHHDVAAVRAAQADLWRRLDGPDPIDHSAHSASRAHYNAYQRALHEPWLRRLGVDPLPDGLFERLCDRWDDPTRIGLFDDTLPALHALCDAGFRLGLVSNWSWGLQDVLDATGVAPLLECSVISARAGYRKPHPAIYRRALAALDLPAADVRFVGDNPYADVAGPLAAGMTPVQIDRWGDAPRTEGVSCIANLEQLAALLGR